MRFDLSLWLKVMELITGPAHTIRNRVIEHGDHRGEEPSSVDTTADIVVFATDQVRRAKAAITRFKIGGAGTVVAINVDPMAVDELFDVKDDKKEVKDNKEEKEDDSMFDDLDLGLDDFDEPPP